MEREDLNLTLNGTPHSFIGWWGDPVVTWRRRGGSWELRWTTDFPINFRHQDMRRGALVSLQAGGRSIWNGILSETNYDTQEFVAIGRCRQAEDAAALGFGVLSSNPAEVVSWGILRGALNWSGLNNLPSVPLTEDADSGPLNTVASVLDAWALSAGVGWWIDPGPSPMVAFAAAPAIPAFDITAGAGVLGLADEEYVSDLYGRHASAPGVYGTVEAHDDTEGIGRVERLVDLTPRGYLTASEAEGLLENMLAATKARTGWTSSVSVSHGQVTVGGTPVALSEVASRPNQMVRLLGLYDERGATTHTDVVVDETVWNVTEQTVEIKPVGLAARDLGSIIESMGGELVAA